MARTHGSKGEVTAAALRGAARTLFARHGFAAVSMRQIAAEIGVQVGTLYVYTSDKQALLFDLLHDHMEWLLEIWPDGGGSPLERLDAFVRFHIVTGLDNADAVFLSYMELRSLSDENFARIAELRRRYEARLEQILIDGQESGAMNVADTRLATRALIAMMNGVTQWFRSEGRLDRERLIAHYIALARGAVGAREGA
ncbi:MAG: TetR/AcrR family transcriptional regulator [Paracoccus sp. (in: a-proteobacteria)]|nr:TetR/AcrR family transcriptional regulator [Paracoccus sp. (in: a-proteobacteria)]